MGGIILIALLGLLFLPLRVSATIYLAAHDPLTNEIGLAYSSSGANFWQIKVKEKGLLGEQSYGLCQNATPKRFLEQGFSASLIAEKLSQQCDQVDWHRYRLVIITTDGDINGTIAKQGCHSGNTVCGKKWGDQFLIIGGGLETGVLEAGLKSYETQDPDQPLVCRLFKALGSVYEAGGEKKAFRGASLTIDHPDQEKLLYVAARGFENKLLSNLKAQLKKGGIACD